MISLTREDMRRHLEQLCRAHNIWWSPVPKRNNKAYAIHRDGERYAHEIVTPPIRGPITYAAALHELGHCLGRYQCSRRTMTREIWAWKWARANALFWTPAMERNAAACLAWYAPRVAKIDRLRRERFSSNWAILFGESGER